jgi:hypothetical protein
MTQVVVITDEQQLTLGGFEFAPNSFCHPVQDAQGRWCVSISEAFAMNLYFNVVEWESVDDEVLEQFPRTVDGTDGKVLNVGDGDGLSEDELARTVENPHTPETDTQRNGIVLGEL